MLPVTFQLTLMEVGVPELTDAVTDVGEAGSGGVIASASFEFSASPLALKAVTT